MTDIEQWQRAGELFGRVDSKLNFGDLTMRMPNPDELALRLTFKVGSQFYSIECWLSARNLSVKSMQPMVNHLVEYLRHEVSKAQNNATNQIKHGPD